MHLSNSHKFWKYQFGCTLPLSDKMLYLMPPPLPKGRSNFPYGCVAKTCPKGLSDFKNPYTKKNQKFTIWDDPKNH